MFLVNSIIVTLVSFAVLFVIFTFILVHTFSRHFTTTVLLTFIFLDSFFRMPFKITNEMYEEKTKVVNRLKKETKITEKQIKQINHVFSNKRRLFLALYKSGAFSYSDRLISVHDWYCKKKFKVRFKIEINLIKQNKRSFNQKYSQESRDIFKKGITNNSGLNDKFA